MTSSSFTDKELAEFTDAVTQRVILALVGNAELSQSKLEGKYVGFISFFGAMDGVCKAIALFALETGKFVTEEDRIGFAAGVGTRLLTLMDEWEEYLRTKPNPYFTIERFTEIN